MCVWWGGGVGGLEIGVVKQAELECNALLSPGLNISEILWIHACRRFPRTAQPLTCYSR